jgi:GDPmannose 4,6-dehydratase
MRALIIGISGQDGTILTNLLFEKGYEVFGTQITSTRIKDEYNQSKIYISKAKISEIDLSISEICFNYLNSVKPDVIYHLAAVHGSSSQMSLIEKNNSNQMYNCHVELTKNLLKWMKSYPEVRLCLALTSQMYTPTHSNYKIDLNSEFNPQNYYAETKLEGFKSLKYYRNKFNIFATGLILFNHTSIYAKNDYLFKQLARQIVKFKENGQPSIFIRDANQEIDISDAFEVCDAIYLASQYKSARDFIITSGKLKSIEQIIIEACDLSSIKIQRSDIVSSEPYKKSFSSVGNPIDALHHLDWRARKDSSEILAEMITHESKLIV